MFFNEYTLKLLYEFFIEDLEDKHNEITKNENQNEENI